MDTFCACVVACSCAASQVLPVVSQLRGERAGCGGRVGGGAGRRSHESPSERCVCLPWPAKTTNRG